jgi:hypothetical protein
MDLRNLQFIFKPQYWLMNHPYNQEVDKIVNELLDKYELTDLCSKECTAKLGKASIWVGNRPYASGNLYKTELENFRPSRLTIQRLLKRFYKLKYQARKEIADIVNEVRSEVL